MVKVVIISQARVGSTRLPSKILKKINGKTILEIHLERIKKSKYSKELILATTNEKGSHEIVKVAASLNIKYYQGDVDDVLDRFYQSCFKMKPDFIVRLTSDCPLIDPVLIDKVVDFAIQNNRDYTTNTLIENFPDGQDIEVIKWKAFKQAWKNAKSKHDREHVTPHIRNNSSFFGKSKYSSINFGSEINFGRVRMTIDEQKDFEAIKILIEKIGMYKDWKTYSEFIIAYPTLFENQNIIRNQGSKNE